jgi:hypothetical protein
MMETSFVYCSVGLGIAIFDAPVPVALMGRPSPRIQLNNCVAIDRCVTLPHRRKIALVELALARGFISLSRLAIWMPVLALCSIAPTWIRVPLQAYGVLGGAPELPIRADSESLSGLLTWLSSFINGVSVPSCVVAPVRAWCIYAAVFVL